MIRNRCPKCKGGPIVHSFFMMCPKCDQCQYKYMAAEGSFMGALFINYMILASSVFPLLVLGLAIYELSPLLVGFLAVVQIIILSPFALRYSRILWVYADSKIS